MRQIKPGPRRFDPEWRYPVVSPADDRYHSRQLCNKEIQAQSRFAGRALPSTGETIE
jgi:hypothetical protein